MSKEMDGWGKAKKALNLVLITAAETAVGCVSECLFKAITDGKKIRDAEYRLGQNQKKRYKNKDTRAQIKADKEFLDKHHKMK